MECDNLEGGGRLVRLVKQPQQVAQKKGVEIEISRQYDNVIQWYTMLGAPFGIYKYVSISITSRKFTKWIPIHVVGPAFPSRIISTHCKENILVFKNIPGSIVYHEAVGTKSHMLRSSTLSLVAPGCLVSKVGWKLMQYDDIIARRCKMNMDIYPNDCVYKGCMDAFTVCQWIKCTLYVVSSLCCASLPK